MVSDRKIEIITSQIQIINEELNKPNDQLIISAIQLLDEMKKENKKALELGLGLGMAFGINILFIRLFIPLSIQSGIMSDFSPTLLTLISFMFLIINFLLAKCWN